MTYTAKNYSAGIDKRGKHFPNFYIEHRENDDGTRNIEAEQTILGSILTNNEIIVINFIKII